ncbi:hypothetical protein ACQP2X_13095 [Actinoplanes sp. CA-131856]
MVDCFDDAEFAPYLHRARISDAGLTTMAELGDTADHRRALYELNKTCSADIPDRGTFYTYDEYVAQRIDVAGFDPRGVVLATRFARSAGYRRLGFVDRAVFGA